MSAQMGPVSTQMGPVSAQMGPGSAQTGPVSTQMGEGYRINNVRRKSTFFVCLQMTREEMMKHQKPATFLSDFHKKVWDLL